MIRDPAEEYGPEPAPCKQPAAAPSKHPRYPSGVCIICGALPEQACRFHDEEEEDE